MNEQDIKLHSLEWAVLWTAYISNSMSVCVLKHFSQNIDDADTRTLIETSLKFAQTNNRWLSYLFTAEHFPIPQGFTDSDVNIQAPRLYSDTFYLYYITNMAIVGLGTYGAALASVSREDVRKFFSECIHQSEQLHSMGTNLQLTKGIFVKSPMIPTPDKVNFVQSDNYLTGFFGEKRPLNVIEIGHLFMNIIKNSLGRALLFGFAQVSESKQVRQYCERGINISKKHIRILSDRLIHSNLPAPMTWDSEVQDSTANTFSDKLIMYHIALLNGISVGNYGIGIGASPRRDIALMYTRLIAEVGFYAEDGAEIVIEKGWLEEPPMANDRRELARSK